MFSLMIFPYFSRAEKHQDIPLRMGGVFSELPLNPMPDTVGWQVSVNFHHRYEQLRNENLLWPDGSIFTWDYDELKQRYYFIINENAHFWDRRSLTTQDVKWALNRAHNGDCRVNKWHFITFTEEQVWGHFMVTYTDGFRGDVKAIPMLLAALFEKA